MENFRKVANLLKKSFPQYDMSIKRVKTPKDTHGDCDFKREKFFIRVANELDEDAAILILIHEVSHVLSWHKPGTDHGLEWGKAYSKVYQVYLDEWVLAQE